jgi:hypothetical protein
MDTEILPYQKKDAEQLAEEIEDTLGGATESRLLIYEHICHKDAIKIPNQDLEWYFFMEQGDHRDLYREDSSSLDANHWHLPSADETPLMAGNRLRDTEIRYDLGTIRDRGVFKPALWG